MALEAGKRPVSKRFAKRHEEIIRAASRHINAYGVRGMTLTAVARDLKIDTSSLLYYFRNKDDLAVACLGRTLEWQRNVAQMAAAEGNLPDVMRSFVNSFMDLHRRSSPTPPLAVLSDMHSLSGDSREQLFSAYGETIRILVSRFRSGGLIQSRAFVAAAVVLAASHWLTAWIHSYRDADFPRVEARLLDLLRNGIGGETASTDTAVDLPDDGDDAQSKFLLAATGLLNRDGYHGASVEKIAGELGVSTGSFYHHLDNKDELVVACFERSHRLFERAFDTDTDVNGSEDSQLIGAMKSLVARQLISNRPLLRTGTYQALPPDLRRDMLALAQQDTFHVAGMISDAIADGTVRPIDPLIGGHFFTTIVTAAGDLKRWDEIGDTTELAWQLTAALSKGLI